MDTQDLFIRRPSLSYFISMKYKSSSYLNKMYVFEMFLLIALTWTMFFMIKYVDTTVPSSMWFIVGCFNIAVMLLEISLIIHSLKYSLNYGEGRKAYAKSLYLIFFIIVVVLTLLSAYDVFTLL